MQNLLELLLVKAKIDRAQLARALGIAPGTAIKWGRHKYPTPQYAIAYLELLIKHNELVRARETDGLDAIVAIAERLRKGQ
jgi:hypothetical protein